MQKNFQILIIVCVVCAALLFPSCDSIDKGEYYSQKENYINATGTLEHIAYNDDCTVLYLSFSDLSASLDDMCFKIVGDNLQIVKENGIDEKLEVGDQVTFVTAPKYFGDGYVMPIVAISADEEELLKLEDGISNLMKWLKAT